MPDENDYLIEELEEMGLKFEDEGKFLCPNCGEPKTRYKKCENCGYEPFYFNNSNVEVIYNEL